MKGFLSKNDALFKKELSALLLDFKSGDTKLLADKNILPDMSDVKELLKGNSGKYKEEFKAFVSGESIKPYGSEEIKYDPDKDLKLIDDKTNKNIEEKNKRIRIRNTLSILFLTKKTGRHTPGSVLNIF